MLDTTDLSFMAPSQGLSATTQRAPAPEFLRLLRSLTSPHAFEEMDRSSANPSSDRAGRFALLNDVTGRKLRVFRKSPCPPQCRESSINVTEPTEAPNASSPRCSEERGRLVGSHPPIERVGRLELLNDVTGRELRVFRKSPCPPRSKRSSSPSSPRE